MSCTEQALLAVQVIMTAILLLTLIVFYFQLRTMRSVMIHQVLRDILMEYRSAEMLLAVNTLWVFYREHPEDFVRKYEETRRRDEGGIAKLPPKERAEVLRSTLDYLRRFVSHYYALLGGLYELKIITKDILYTYWSGDDLRIIPEILIPIERKLAETVGTLVEHDKGLARMKKLYDDGRFRFAARQ